MKRFILVCNGENIFRDKRSFKTKRFAEKKARHFKEWEVWSNKIIGVKVEEIEVETKEEELEERILDLTTQLEIAFGALEKMKSKAAQIACYQIWEWKENRILPILEKNKIKPE